MEDGSIDDQHADFIRNCGHTEHSIFIRSFLPQDDPHRWDAGKPRRCVPKAKSAGPYKRPASAAFKAKVATPKRTPRVAVVEEDDEEMDEVLARELSALGSEESEEESDGAKKAGFAELFADGSEFGDAAPQTPVDKVCARDTPSPERTLPTKHCQKQDVIVPHLNLLLQVEVKCHISR